MRSAVPSERPGILPAMVCTICLEPHERTGEKFCGGCAAEIAEQLARMNEPVPEPARRAMEAEIGAVLERDRAFALLPDVLEVMDRAAAMETWPDRLELAKAIRRAKFAAGTDGIRDAYLEISRVALACAAAIPKARASQQPGFLTRDAVDRVQAAV